MERKSENTPDDRPGKASRLANFGRWLFTLSPSRVPLRRRAQVALTNGTIMSIAFPMFALVTPSRPSPRLELLGVTLVFAILSVFSVFVTIWGYKTLKELDSE